MDTAAFDYDLPPGRIAQVPVEPRDAARLLVDEGDAPPRHLRVRDLPDLLNPGGRFIITTPSPKVDEILHLLIKLRVIDGMEAHEHYGFDPRTVPEIFASDDLVLEKRARFQLGLNHLFVFRRP